MICSYCRQETADTQKCENCFADLTIPRPKMNPDLSELEAERTQPELIQMHTYDLLLILSHIRAKRSDWYLTMQRVRKAPVQAKIDLKIDDESIQFAEKEYRRYTAQKNIIEQILIDRMGYYPQKVNDRLLEALIQRIERSNS